MSCAARNSTDLSGARNAKRVVIQTQIYFDSNGAMRALNMAPPEPVSAIGRCASEAVDFCRQRAYHHDQQESQEYTANDTP